jgi:hypothetical protein
MSPPDPAPDVEAEMVDSLLKLTTRLELSLSLGCSEILPAEARPDVSAVMLLLPERLMRSLLTLILPPVAPAVASSVAEAEIVLFNKSKV